MPPRRAGASTSASCIAAKQNDTTFDFAVIDTAAMAPKVGKTAVQSRGEGVSFSLGPALIRSLVDRSAGPLSGRPWIIQVCTVPSSATDTQHLGEARDQTSQKKFFFRPVRVYWLRCHSGSASLFSRVPMVMEKGFMVKRGPTSLNSTEL